MGGANRMVREAEKFQRFAQRKGHYVTEGGYIKL